MLDPNELDRAVEIARRAYVLLRWVIEGFERGIVTLDESRRVMGINRAACEILEVERPNVADPPRGCSATPTAPSGLWLLLLGLLGWRRR